MNKEPENKPENHEHRDLNVPAVAATALGLTVVVVIIFFSVHWLQDFLGVERTARTSALNAAASSLPPEPRLQSDPASDLQRFQKQQNAILDSYGWVDQKAGIARIPIERAMDFIAEHGLPPPPASAIGKTPLQMRQEKTNRNQPAS